MYSPFTGVVAADRIAIFRSNWQFHQHIRFYIYVFAVPEHQIRILARCCCGGSSCCVPLQLRLAVADYVRIQQHYRMRDRYQYCTGWVSANVSWGRTRRRDRILLAKLYLPCNCFLRDTTMTVHQGSSVPAWADAVLCRVLVD